jgi:predicted chitinase
MAEIELIVSIAITIQDETEERDAEVFEALKKRIEQDKEKYRFRIALRNALTITVNHDLSTLGFIDENTAYSVTDVLDVFPIKPPELKED